MEQVVTNLQRQLSSQQEALQQLEAVLEAQQASAAQMRERERCKLSRQTCQTALNLNMAKAEVGEPEPVARRHRAFIESRAFSKLTNSDSKAASSKDWALKFENTVASVVPSSRESLGNTNIDG